MKLLLDLLSKYEKSAKRLETLNSYKIDGDEWEEYIRYVNGIPEYNFEQSDWFKDINEKTKSGITTERVRVLPQIINSYIKFEIETGYLPNSIAGEKFYFISENMYNKLATKEQLGDYWIFDDEKLLKLNYNSKGEFISSQLIYDNVFLNKQLELFEECKKASDSLSDILKLIRKKEIEYNL